MAPEDIKKTAITTPFGLFEFVSMPFGLKNATQTFQRFMDSIFRDLDFVFCYVDDIIIASTDETQHQLHLRQVFERLQKHNLCINVNKCFFNKQEIQYLGFTVSKYGIKPPTERVAAVSNYKKPKTLIELRRFLGILNYFRRCIYHAAHIQAPLNELLKDSKKNDTRPVPWTPSTEKAFDLCKNSLSQATMLVYPDTTASLVLTTDASNTAIGAVLEQKKNDELQPMGFFSRKLSTAEKNYSPYDRELLAIYAAIKFFRHILEGRDFLIRTDHKPLTYAFAQKLDRASPRQLRHLDFIAQFSTNIIHLSGHDNTVADAMSRINAISMPTSIEPAELATEQQHDEELKELLKETSSLKLQKLSTDTETAIYCDTSAGIIRPYIPKKLRYQAFLSIHGLSHPSGKSTSHQLRQKYVWPNIKKDTLEWCRNCIACQKSKIHRYHKNLPGKFEIPNERFEHIHMDIVVMPLDKEYRYCLTIIDRFSRWPEAIPLKDISADTVATAFYNTWICRYGAPRTLTTDQGTQFESSLFNALTNMLGTKRIHSSPYHPASNGLIERWHRTFKAAMMCHQSISWTEILPTVLLGLRTCYKEDLHASAAEFVYGSTLRIPGEFFFDTDMQPEPQIFLEKFREYIRAIRPQPTTHHKKKSMFHLKNLYNCSHVFLKTDAVKKPLEQPYSGPFEVIKRIDDYNFVIKVADKEVTVSTERLKPAYIIIEETLQQSFQQQNPVNLDQQHTWLQFNRPLRVYTNKKKSTVNPNN